MRLGVVGWGDLGYTAGDNENCIAGTSSMPCMKASQCLSLQQLVFAYQPDNQGERSPDGTEWNPGFLLRTNSGTRALYDS